MQGDEVKIAAVNHEEMAQMSMRLTPSLKDSGNRNPPSGQNFEQCILLFILPGIINSLKLNCAATTGCGQWFSGFRPVQVLGVNKQEVVVD